VAAFFQNSTSAFRLSILDSISSIFSAFLARDLRAAIVLRARFTADVSLGSGTTMGGRVWVRLRTPDVDDRLCSLEVLRKRGDVSGDSVLLSPSWPC